MIFKYAHVLTGHPARPTELTNTYAVKATTSCYYTTAYLCISSNRPALSMHAYACVYFLLRVLGDRHSVVGNTTLAPILITQYIGRPEARRGIPLRSAPDHPLYHPELDVINIGGKAGAALSEAVHTACFSLFVTVNSPGAQLCGPSLR